MRPNETVPSAGGALLNADSGMYINASTHRELREALAALREQAKVLVAEGADQLLQDVLGHALQAAAEGEAPGRIAVALRARVRGGAGRRHCSRANWAG